MLCWVGRAAHAFMPCGRTHHQLEAVVLDERQVESDPCVLSEGGGGG
eukprot:SAG22_NODE_6887_length_798_cov_1.935622_1_plen_46_part_10